MKDCTTCKYGYEDEQLGFPMCHHSEVCIDFNLHEEKISNDLEEAASIFSKNASNDHNYHYLRIGFIFGAKWQKERMMKEAVEADVMLTLHDKTGDISLHTGYLPKELGIKCDDKVRIIIVKED